MRGSWSKIPPPQTFVALPPTQPLLSTISSPRPAHNQLRRLASRFSCLSRRLVTWLRLQRALFLSPISALVPSRHPLGITKPHSTTQRLYDSCAAAIHNHLTPLSDKHRTRLLSHPFNFLLLDVPTRLASLFLCRDPTDIQPSLSTIEHSGKLVGPPIRSACNRSSGARRRPPSG